jgi:hypothetical protein
MKNEAKHKIKKNSEGFFAVVVFCFETRSCYTVVAGLKLMILSPLLPKCTTMLAIKAFDIKL